MVGDAPYETVPQNVNQTCLGPVSLMLEDRLALYAELVGAKSELNPVWR